MLPRLNIDLAAQGACMSWDTGSAWTTPSTGALLPATLRITRPCRHLPLQHGNRCCGQQPCCRTALCATTKIRIYLTAGNHATPSSFSPALPAAGALSQTTWSATPPRWPTRSSTARRSTAAPTARRARAPQTLSTTSWCGTPRSPAHQQANEAPVCCAPQQY